MIELKIVNDGTGTDTIGNYDVSVLVNGQVLDRARVEGHNRAEGWKILLRRLVCGECQTLERAAEQFRVFECPRCHVQFEDPGLDKEFPAGIKCPKCTGGLIGVIFPRWVKRAITQDEWDAAQLELARLQQKLQGASAETKRPRFTADQKLGTWERRGCEGERYIDTGRYSGIDPRFQRVTNISRDQNDGSQLHVTYADGSGQTLHCNTNTYVEDKP